MAGRQYQQVAYGLSQALIAENPSPIIAKRNPTNKDFAFPTTIWTNTTNNALYILASVANNTANWVLLEVGGGAGIFANLTVTPGPISLTGTTSINTTGAAVTTIGTGGTGAVNIGNTTGNTLVTGDLTATVDITANTGNIVALLGDIDATAGNMSAAGTVTGGTGVIATTGNVSATAGAVSANTTVTAGTGISTATGNIAAAAGTVTGGTGVIATTGNITASAGNVVATGATSGFVFGTSTIKILSGAGAPVVVAPQGSLYLRTDGTTVNDRAYIATNGAGAWTAITTAA
jgi:hypothetical protein